MVNTHTHLYTICNTYMSYTNVQDLHFMSFHAIYTIFNFKFIITNYIHVHTHKVYIFGFLKTFLKSTFSYMCAHFLPWKRCISFPPSLTYPPPRQEKSFFRKWFCCNQWNSGQVCVLKKENQPTESGLECVCAWPGHKVGKSFWMKMVEIKSKAIWSNKFWLN